MKNIIKLKDFLKNNILTNLKINESQTKALYFVNTLNIEKNNYEKEVIVLEFKTLKSNKMELPFIPDDFYFKGDMIIFKVIKKDNTLFYSYNEDIEEIINIPFVVNDIAFSDEEFYFISEIQKFDSKTIIKCSKTGPFYENGKGIVGNSIVSLFKSSMDVKDISLITSLDMDIDQIDFDLKNNRIMFTAFDVKKLKAIKSNVYSYNILSQEIKLHTENNYRISYIKSMDKNKMIFTGVNLNERSRNDNQQLYLVDEAKGNVKRLGDYVDLSNENPSIVTDSVFSTSKPIKKYKDDFYYLRVNRDREMLYRINLNGEITEIDTGLKVINSYEVVDNGILLIGLNDLKLHELYFYSNGNLKQISNYNKWLEEYKLSKPEKLNFDYEDIEFDGYVFKPISFDENKNYPAVLIIHGGPKMIYSDVYSHDVQLLCSKGYFVFYFNPMGSDGRGDEFANIRGSFGKKPFKQFMKFTDEVLKKYKSIDEKRLGVTGGSYGGYMTNYIIGHTKRFSAAVSERGISSMMTAFTSSDIGYKFIYEYMGNNDTPWSNMDAYIEESPITYADNVETPTLFIHGKDDYRCHYTESLNMYSALNYLGVDSKICLFDGEHHGLVVSGKPQSKERRYSEMIDWFDKYLKRG